VILLVAATEAELCGHPGLVCGVGPVEAAAATARALAGGRPDAVVHVGLAGGRGLEAGTLVVGTESVYVDIVAAIPVVSRVEPDSRLLAAVREAFPEAPALPIATSAAVGEEPVPGTSGARHRWRERGGAPAVVQAMEGFAVLRACELAGVRALEVRAVSNAIGEDDRARWEIRRGLEALAATIPRLLSALGAAGEHA
jgi:futalosine hydrolase